VIEREGRKKKEKEEKSTPVPFPRLASVYFLDMKERGGKVSTLGRSSSLGGCDTLGEEEKGERGPSLYYFSIYSARPTVWARAASGTAERGKEKRERGAREKIASTTRASCGACRLPLPDAEDQKEEKRRKKKEKEKKTLSLPPLSTRYG